MSRMEAEQRVLFTKEMKETHTILVPEMLPIHFEIMQRVMQNYGYKLEFLQNTGANIVQTGLRYVHNDACYPALLLIGQLLEAVQSGKYDTDRVALLLPQSGGGCRASNYVHLLRKALAKAGLAHIPVISLNVTGMEANPGFTLSVSMIRRMLAAVYYGDLLMLLRNQVRPYEIHAGETDLLVAHWINRIGELLCEGKGVSSVQMKRVMKAVAAGFSAITVGEVQRTKVGIVGEIYVRYSPLGNNNLEAFLHSQECECLVPGLLGYVMFSVDVRLEDIRLYGGSKWKYAAISTFMRYLEILEQTMIDVVAATRFQPPGTYQHKRGLVDGVIGHGSKMGEGWLLTAEMLELIEQGYQNIVCAQPFGCMPNHINGRGMMNRIKELEPMANIVAIDYDPGAARVNQENRIKLMLASATSAKPVLPQPQRAAGAADGAGAFPVYYEEYYPVLGLTGQMDQTYSE